ncbi:hypothetical protein [Teichococcus coralli]|uniref:hypothetical protein n=1 Tax=Teichococcus coralli TaxID=2545983 RepID=UPI00136B2B8B|nr:hypothetical protein [Pseudoroseomonas coralli]
MPSEENFDFCCSECGYWELAYVSKSGRIGCYGCGIHPDAADAPADDGGADRGDEDQ